MVPFCLVVYLVALFDCSFAIDSTYIYVHFNKEITPNMWERKGIHL